MKSKEEEKKKKKKSIKHMANVFSRKHQRFI